MKAAEIRASILQEAVSGKLVPQIASEGTADELLKQIEAKRSAFMNSGNIKKENPLQEITEDDVPFEIPKSWKWVRIGDIFQHNNGKQLNGTDGKGKLLTYITTSNLYWDHFNLGNLSKMPFTDDEIDKCTAVKGDLLVCEGGDFGRAAIWDRDEPIRLQNHIHKLRPYGKLSVKFYHYIFYFYKFTDKIKGKGIGIQGLSARVLHNIIVPLPPLSEQKRIVAKLEELLPLIDQYAEEEDKLSAITTQFPDAMRKSILQEAVSGKLVPQIASEGTADELLKQIEAKRSALMKAGNIKKDKTFPDVCDDEIPCDIPDSWEWMRLGNCADIFIGDSIPEDVKAKRYRNQPEGYNYIGTKDVGFDHIINYNNGVKIPYDEKGFEHAGNGVSLLCIEGGSAGKKIAILEEEVCFGNKLCAFNPILLNPKYLYYYLQSLVFIHQFKDKISGMIGGVTLNKLKHSMIPIPPLSEQERIVVKIEEIMKIIDKLNR